ncbi:MAG: metallophosphoesterase family protein [Desulfobacula sp.]|jgi:predicted phosphodiesterase|nr:metallophosphoesterase family protein [Desulfobacula sp.]
MIRNPYPIFEADAILTSDWHMWEPERNPPCRTDNHSAAQLKKIKQINRIQEFYDCSILKAGDVFEYWKASPELINMCLASFPDELWSIAGQHDLPQHNMELIRKSAFDTLARAGALNFLGDQCSWNKYDSHPKYIEIKGRKVAIAHMLVYKGEPPFPGCTAPEVSKVFKMFPEADLILTGDNHKTFWARKGKQLLINPGSLTRHKADQADHKPCVFIWNAKMNSFITVYLDIEKGVISREHLDLAQDKKERGEAFIKKLNNDWVSELSFEDNIDRAISVNKIDNDIQKWVFKWMGK